MRQAMLPCTRKPHVARRQGAQGCCVVACDVDLWPLTLPVNNAVPFNCSVQSRTQTCVLRIKCVPRTFLASSEYSASVKASEASAGSAVHWRPGPRQIYGSCWMLLMTGANRRGSHQKPIKEGPVRGGQMEAERQEKRRCFCEPSAWRIFSFTSVVHCRTFTTKMRTLPFSRTRPETC